MTSFVNAIRSSAALVVAVAMGWASLAQAQAPTFTPLNPLLPAAQQRFVLDLPIPIDYVPDRTLFPGFDYYEVQMSEVTPVTVAFRSAPGSRRTCRPALTDSSGSAS